MAVIPATNVPAAGSAAANSTTVGSTAGSATAAGAATGGSTRTAAAPQLQRAAAPAVRIHLQIDRLVVPGLAAAGHEHFAAQLQTELSRRLAAPGLAASLDSGARARVRTALRSPAAAGDALPAALAERIVAAIRGERP